MEICHNSLWVCYACGSQFLSLFSQRSHLQLKIKRLCKHTGRTNLLFHQYNIVLLKCTTKQLIVYMYDSIFNRFITTEEIPPNKLHSITNWRILGYGRTAEMKKQSKSVIFDIQKCSPQLTENTWVYCFWIYIHYPHIVHNLIRVPRWWVGL